MRTAVFSTKPYDRQFLQAANRKAGDPHQFEFFAAGLGPRTAVLADGCDAVCAFVNDDLGTETLQVLKDHGVRGIALRCAGFNNVDLSQAEALGLPVLRVPDYSPHAVAEHTLALLLGLIRKIPRAYLRIKEGNYAIDGLMGVDLARRTVGVVGTGKIGSIAARIFRGFGCPVLAHDPYPNRDLEKDAVRFCSWEELSAEADVIALFCPLTPDTYHLVGPGSLSRMKDGVIIVNTSRGGLIDARAAIEGLKSGKIGGLAIDVYEEESGIFFEDLSSVIMPDDILARLTTFPNVVVTAHQAFFTEEAVSAIATTTVANLTAIENGDELKNQVRPG
ncbi:MAG: 2-hydroxyacid dehydrogenase [Opitutales bacterium]